MLTIRAAQIEDLPAILEIYTHHVVHGSASFEVAPPLLAEMRARFETILAAGYPYIVAMREGRVAGYAYASAYRARFAYRFTVENSIYIAHDQISGGVGRALMEALIAQCEARGYRQMIAVIGDSANAASIGLHARLGFRFAGVLPAVGYKHERWIDSVLMARALGGGDQSAPQEIITE
jgi:L-amino acid N-acyltransferase YncA